MKAYDIILVGAGLAGLTAASRLREAGKEFLLVDKGKSVGGRLATRRVAEGKADHGAQFFTVRTKELQSEVEHWLKKGWIMHWFGEDYPRYTSVNGMNGLAKHLSEGLEIELNHKVTRVSRSADGFIVTADNGKEWRGSKLIITTPAPQAVSLLQKSGIDSGAANAISFLPTYVGIFHFMRKTDLPSSGHIDHQLPEGVERIVDHQKKGISKDVIVSVYMTAVWSYEHYGETGVLELMKEQVKGHLPFDDIKEEQLKKWRYAQAADTFSGSYLEVADGVFMAGDAFLRSDDSAGRTRFESAFISGVDTAAAIMK
ncbi:NAD(P)/FAD-dependent oxidoreductase [Halobacillus sp. A5]|uniref:NAD(P)/FAD-dependent oxidoreductase n=1 Tax=Halobacillus sp. A5 TaxID=2880263 RepID=UPI0020A64E79|nr:FAD-dependent oxidoreductase [Halobacillus sp. A5]MCP3027444.1 FAD-dependent oxidoreductase [Halobacillus sp. A5]